MQKNRYKEEYIQKACQELQKLGRTKSEIHEFREYIEDVHKNRKEVKSNPQDVLDFWTVILLDGN